MAHHFDEMPSDFRKQLFGEAETGPTNKFPHGKLHDSDEGEIQIAVGSDPEKDVVLIEFGKPIAYLGMTPQQAMDLAQSLIKHARAIAKEPLKIELH